MPYKDPQKNKEAKQKSHEKHREKNRARLAAYYAADPDKFKKRNKEWRTKNRDKMLATLKEYRKNNYEKVMLIGAKYRAKKLGFPCTITLEDIIIPEYCPVLGIKLSSGAGKWAASSPSLDKIRPEEGYVPGNVRVISWRANCLKRDGTAEEFERIAAYLRGEL